jgi:tRNA threonylcarbamoyladenosine biosynthesis protein TsaE
MTPRGGRSTTTDQMRAGTPEEMRDIGARLADLLRAGDLVVLIGELGAGKTTLVQGIGAGLGVRGPITSPTFVLAREHPPLSEGAPALVHVDAYRLGNVAEVADLDLESALDDAVVVVEWGSGLVEDLVNERLDVIIELGDGDERRVRLVGIGDRWAAARLAI